MIKLIKFLFSFLGSLLIGFGLCLVVGGFIKEQFSEINYRLIYSGILIAGGFFLGLSFIIKKQKSPDKKIKEEKAEKETKERKEQVKKPPEIINSL